MKIIPGPRGKYQLKSEYDPKLVEKIKSVPGLTWEPKSRMWQGYWDAFVTLGDKIGNRLGAPLGRIDCDDLPVDALKPEKFGLRDYQDEAVNWMRQTAAEGCILALEMGLGKTVCTLMLQKSLNAKMVVVCPAYVKGVWVAETIKWLGDDKLVVMCKGTSLYELPKGWDIAIINYDILHAWAPKLIEEGVKLVAFDEVHIAVDEKSRRAQAMRAIAAACDYRVGLTGTPFTGRLKALWNVCDTLSPGRFGSFFKYGMAYCGGHTVTIDFRSDGPKTVYDFSGSSREEELAKRLQHFMFRRTRQDVALELPPMTRQIIRVDCKASRIDYSDFTQEMFRAALEAAADSKFPEVCRLVQGHAEEGHKIIVFTYRKAVAEAVAREMAMAGIDAAFIHSGVSEAKRESIMAAPPQVIAATIDSVQMGISLTHADVGVFAELSYAPHKLRQAEARLHRFGQQAAGVLIQYVIGGDSVDELVVDRVLSKLDTEAAVIGENGALAGDLRGNSEEDAFASIIAGLS